MQLRTFWRKSVFGMFGKAALATVALSGFFLFAGASQAQAADRDDCYRRVARAEHRLDEAIEHHGYYSRQADHQRHELREARERCGYYRDGYRQYDRDRY